MIVFNNWTLTVTGLIARQYDNLSRRIDVEGDLPAGYTWQLLVQCGGNADTILLEATEKGAGAVLTADNLSRSGEYYIQLRGVLEADGVTRRHTNVVSAYIPESLTGIGTWPEVPTEFAQVEARILELYQHPPIPGSNGYWLVWDTDKDEYVESQLALPDVSVGPQGPNGKSAYQYAQEGGYTGTEAEFSAKLAAKIPDKLPNPNALTFTGAVTGRYDGSAPVSVEIPSGSSGESQWKLLASIELNEDVQSIHLTSDDSGSPFSCKEFIVQIAAVIRSSVSSIKFAKAGYSTGFDVPDISVSSVFMQLNSFGNTSGARYYVFRRTMEAGLNRTVFVESNKNIFGDIGAVANGVYDDGTQFDTVLYDTAISDLLVYATKGFLTGDKIRIYGR